MKTNTLLLLGGAAVAVYLITRPKTPTLPPAGAYPPGYYPVNSNASTVNTIANDSASVLSTLFNNIFP